MKTLPSLLLVLGLCLFTLVTQFGCDSGGGDDDDNNNDDDDEQDDDANDDDVGDDDLGDDDTTGDDDASDDDTAGDDDVSDDDTTGDDDTGSDDDTGGDDDTTDDDDDTISNWALSFSGVDQFAATANDVTPILSGSFTVEGWFRMDASVGANLTLIDGIYASTNPSPPPSYLFEGGYLLLYASAEQRVHFCYVNLSGGLPCVQSSEINDVSGWTHIAATFSGGQACLYINGVQNNCGSSMGAYAAHAAKLFLGKRKAYMEDPSYYKGQMDEIRISTTVRYEGNFTPAAELAADADTVVHYSFEEGSGQIAMDDSGNANHLTLSGATFIAH